jgi:hypothetical protein
MTLDRVSSITNRIRIGVFPLKFYVDTASVPVMVFNNAYAKKHVLCLLTARLATPSVGSGAMLHVKSSEYVWKDDSEEVVLATAELLARRLVEHEVLEQFHYTREDQVVIRPFDPHVVKPLIY